MFKFQVVRRLNRVMLLIFCLIIWITRQVFILQDWGFKLMVMLIVQILVNFIYHWVIKYKGLMIIIVDFVWFVSWHLYFIVVPSWFLLFVYFEWISCLMGVILFSLRWVRVIILVHYLIIWFFCNICSILFARLRSHRRRLGLSLIGWIVLVDPLLWDKYC